MKPLSVMLLFLATAAFAREERLPGGDAPFDKRYYITVVQSKSAISYNIRSTSNGRLLTVLHGSYKSNPSDSKNRAFAQALTTKTHWHLGTHGDRVALEESGFDGATTIIVACRTSKGFRRLPLNASELAQRTGLLWTDSRLSFQSWEDHDSFYLDLIGHVRNDTGAESGTRSFRFLLARDGHVLSSKSRNDAQ